MIFPAMPKSRLLLIINADFCVLRSLRFSICACKRCSAMVSVSASFSLHIDYPPLPGERKPCRAAADLTRPLPHSAGRSGSASEPLCLPPADVCINKPTIPARTAPFTAAPSRQGGIFFPRKGRRGGGTGRCGNAPKVSRRSCCADPGLAGPLPEMEKHKRCCFYFFSWLFSHLLNSVLPPVWASLQPCSNHPALIHAKEGLLSLG